jgi:hypothetical protein
MRKFKDYINTKKNLIDEMMENEHKKIGEQKEKDNNKMDLEENNDINKIKNNKQNTANIDMSLFFKLASINYDSYNKMIKEQNKQNTKDPEIKILGFDEYLKEYVKQ